MSVDPVQSGEIQRRRRKPYAAESVLVTPIESKPSQETQLPLNAPSDQNCTVALENCIGVALPVTREITGKKFSELLTEFKKKSSLSENPTASQIADFADHIVHYLLQKEIPQKFLVQTIKYEAAKLRFIHSKHLLWCSFYGFSVKAMSTLTRKSRTRNSPRVTFVVWMKRGSVSVPREFSCSIPWF